MRTAATRPLWYASHSQKYGCQRKVAARNMPTTKPAKRTAPATATDGGEPARLPRPNESCPSDKGFRTGCIPSSSTLFYPRGSGGADGSRRGAAGRGGDAGFRPPPAPGTGPRDLGPPSGLRGRPRRAGRLDPAVPAARDPRAPRQDARPEQGGAGRDRGGLQARVLEEPRRRLGRGEAGPAVPQGPREADPRPREPRQLPRDNPRGPPPTAGQPGGHRRVHDRPRARGGLDGPSDHHGP